MSGRSKGVVGQLKRIGSQLEIQWEIPDFLSLPAEVDEYYFSPQYFLDETSWVCVVCPNGSKINALEGQIVAGVGRQDPGPPVTVACSFFLKMKEGKKLLFQNKNKTKTFGASLFKRSQLIDLESEYMPSGALTFICTLKLDGEREVKDLKSKALAAALQDTKVLRDYKRLFMSEENCDVTLEVGGSKFEAHRAILGARSPVFASMLKHDMKENKTGLINIEDCEQTIFKDFLQFLYCGSVENLSSQNMCSLYRVADKYDVQDLKSECLAFIKHHLDIDSFCDIITLALQHNEADLIKQATDFFVSNMLKIVLTVKWQVFLHENTAEGNELIIKAARKMPNP